MKAIITSALYLFSLPLVFGQGSVTMTTENSQVNYSISNNGVMFNNPFPGSHGGYFVPKDSLVSAIFVMSPAAVGYDANDQLKGAVAKYQSSDFYRGPIASNYNDSIYLSRFGTCIWHMTKGVVDSHIAHWMDQGYVIPGMIASWPGNGNTSNGESAVLAPFHDMNGDQIYTPSEGDYPLIFGDRATYVIVNDGKGAHPSGLVPIQIEMHLMIYQYENPADEILTRTTFVHTTLYNRGTNLLNNFHFGHLIDFDLGNPQDDYIGTEPGRALAYVYNGDLVDEDFVGNGYESNPPAVGVVALDRPLASHVPLYSYYPTNAAQYNHVLSGVDVFGDPILDENGLPTPHIYNEAGAAGWNEVTANSVPGDRFTATSHPAETFGPGSKLCYNHAVVYARSNEGTIFASVDSLFEVTDYVREFFNTQNLNCIASLELNEQMPLTFSIYPNPATDNIHIEGLTAGSYRILNLEGKEIQSGNLAVPSIQVEALKNGFYILEISSGGKHGRKSFVKE